MDAKDLRTETTIGDGSSNGSSKFAQVGAAAPCSVNKPYDNHSANPLAKLEAPSSRPCAVIGPDRIVPPSSGDGYSKKGHYEPWLHVDNTYRQPPEYPHKIPSYQSPIRNISPRQTFQENMQRIMVQPSYNSVKLNDDPNYTLERNATKNNKITGPHEAKYCDVPYSVNPISSDQKPNEMCVNNMNSTRNYPQVWHPGGVGIRPTRPYGAPDFYQFSEFANCTGPRPMPMPRPHRTMNEDPSHAYNEAYYPEGNIRFKPYPTVKERYPPARYEYVSNYSNPFHPPPFPSHNHKYDLQKPLPPHVTYPQIPIKYLENRMTDTIMDGYQRPQPVNYNVQYRNQVIHPTYGPMIGSNIPNKVYPYQLEGPVKSLASNKLPYDNKLYTEYENARNKGYPMSDNVYHMKNQPILPNYPTGNMQPTHAHPYYRKESLAIRNYEYLSHLRHLDPSMNPNAMTRLSTQFSPNSIAISPSDSNTSNETSHTHGGSLEDCGYVSQSSTTSIRSFDGMNRMMPNDFYQRYNYPYQTMVRTSPLSSKLDGNGAAISSKGTKNIDVRQFLQSWNEGEEENGSKEKEVVNQSDFNSNKLANQYGAMKNHEQLYVLGLVNVPSEELSKYEHIQKISKLPENIKGYNNIELLKHFEEAIESSNINNPHHKQPTSRNYHSSMKSSSIQGTGLLPPRPISPLDVEAKISQSVIHKEVGCNFEIKPCSPEMLNAEVATTAQSIIGEERVIEKVSNPIIIKSPMLSSSTESEKNCDVINRKEHRILLKEDINKTPSCKMIHTQCSNNDSVNIAKSNYSLQDLESNAGVCLASLPRLDNDIELTFPEVNQQFINANKESVIIANDYTTEEPMQTDNNYKADENSITKPENTSSVMPILDLEKEVSKLSKYRKIKRNDVEFKENNFLSVSQSLRTDSVIIKNPENTKSFEKKSKILPLVKETNETLNNDLTNGDPVCESNQTTADSNEMAIDFSLTRVEDKHSKYFCEMYSTKNINSPPAKLPEDQQFNTNTSCNLPSDNTNDITIKVPISDVVNDINFSSVSDNIKNCNELDFGKLDITELNDVENNMVADFSENVAQVENETKNCNIVDVSTADQMNTVDHDHEITKKSIKLTENIERMNTSSVHLGLEKVDDTILYSDSLSAEYKETENNVKNSNISNEKNIHSSVSYKNCDLKNNTSSSVECELTVTKPYCSNKYKDDLQKLVTPNDTTQSVVAGKPVFRKLVENKNCKIDLFVKQFSLNKELFSPQIQNLILWNEGQSGLNVSLQNENKISSDKELKEDIITRNKLNTFQDLNIGQPLIKCTNVQDYRIFDSEMDGLAVDNLASNELQKVSSDVKATEVTAIDRRFRDCTYGELQLGSSNFKDYADSDLDAEVSDADNSIKDCTNVELQSESTNVKAHADSDLNADVSVVENTEKDCTNNKLQSEFTYVKDYADSDLNSEVSFVNDCKDCTYDELQSKSTYVIDYADADSDAEIGAVDKIVKDCTNNEPLSEIINPKDCANSDLDAKVSAVDNSVKDCSYDALRSESTNVKYNADSDFDAQVSAVDNSVKDCTYDELQSESTYVKYNADSDLEAQVSTVDNNVRDCTNNEPLSEIINPKDCANSDLDAKVSAVDNSVKDCSYDALRSESTNVKDYADSASDAEVIAVDNSVKDCTYDELQSESTIVKDYADYDLDAGVFAVDNSFKDSTNNALQSKSKNKDYLDSDSYAQDTIFKDCVNDRLQIKSISDQDSSDSNSGAHNTTEDNSVKDNKNDDELQLGSSNDCLIAASEVFATDYLNSITHLTNNTLKSQLTNIKDCLVSKSDAEVSNIDGTDNINNFGNDQLDKDFPVSNSDVNASKENSRKFINREFQLKPTDVKDLPILGSTVKFSDVDSLNSVNVGVNSKLYSQTNIVKNCEISNTNEKLSVLDRLNIVKTGADSELQLKSAEVNDFTTSGSDVETSVVNSFNSAQDFAHSKLQLRSTNSNDYPTLDTCLENSCMDSINSVENLNQNALYSKSSNCKEPSCDSADFEIESGNVHDETCLSNDVSLNGNVPHSNKYINSNLKESEIINDVLSDVRPIAVYSDVHGFRQKSNNFDGKSIETNNLISGDPNICSKQNSVEILDQIRTNNEDPEIIMSSNTKASLIRRSLKRSLSDSALFFYNNNKSENFFQEDIQVHDLITTKRRKKNNECINTCEPHFSANEMLNIHNIRRNSISSIYNEENMSFCIVIDNNCIITEENDEGDKLCYTEIPEECLTGIHTDNFDVDDGQPASEIILCPQENTNEYNEPLVLEISDEKSLEESWVDDVAYVETVVSDDIAEDIEVSAPSSPTEIVEQENDESGIFTSVSEHTEKVKYIYGDKMCNDDAELVETLYRTPQMDVNKTLIRRESHVTDDDDEFLEENLLNNVSPESREKQTVTPTSDNCNTLEPMRVDYINKSNNSTEIFDKPNDFSESDHGIPPKENKKIKTSYEVSQDDTVNSCESSVDDVFAYNQDESSINCSVFSSPEVSSTTSEEKNSSLLLKITNYQGTRTSQLNDLILKKTNSCKFTENINYTNFISNSTEPRPLITKAAQKYIPPLKETVDDLKVKLSLPHESLMKFKQLKMAKTGGRHNAVPKNDIPKKPKPKFEDVLKSLDEIQFKMHKEKRKKTKKPVPKVVIKKTENGSHYASTSNGDCFNPDLTGRKWQPWVFIEKSSFIDKMALRRKTKAIYNHRKNTYVFADKFKKYKSMPSTKFVITQPKLDDMSMGKLKYTIRLKHSY